MGVGTRLSGDAKAVGVTDQTGGVSITVSLLISFLTAFQVLSPMPFPSLPNLGSEKMVWG